MEEKIKQVSDELGSMDDEEFEAGIKEHEDGDIANAINENLDRDTFNTSLDGHDHYQHLINGFLKKKINVKIFGLSPEHEKEAIKMIAGGTPVGEVADIFGIARSDIAYVNG